LLTEFTQTLYAVADDVYMNVEFNQAYVKQYRLIGFDNKVGALKDSLSVIEGGEIGSGHSMIALFEIVPTEINLEAIKNNVIVLPGKLADIKLQYRYPNNNKQCQSTYISQFDFIPFDKLDKSYRFSAAVAMYGTMLRSSLFTKNIGWNEVIALAQEAADTSDPLQKEFVSLVQQSKTLYSKVKKKKGNLTER
jgi:Ca-activated chloride channel family protein